MLPKRAVAIVLVLTALTAQAGTSLPERLPALLDDAMNGTAPAVMLHIEMPTRHLAWSALRGAGADVRQPLRIASNTKTYVAAAILRLWEQGHLVPDNAIAPHLLPTTPAMLRGAGHDPGAITLRMLLQHTSGLPDYASHPGFLARVEAAPEHRWTRAEQLAMALGQPAAARPGEAFRYSDTGYILLGEILEVSTGRPLAAALRDALDFATLGLHQTWLETLEPEPPDVPPRAMQSHAGMPVSRIDASADLFGGGGLVASLPDLAAFLRALLEGRVFRAAGTLQAMLAASPESRATGLAGYGMGIARREEGGLLCFGHDGFWGTTAWHCPEAGATFAAAVTDTAARETLGTLTRRVMRLLSEAR